MNSECGIVQFTSIKSLYKVRFWVQNSHPQALLTFSFLTDDLILESVESPVLTSKNTTSHGLSDMETDFGDIGGSAFAFYFCVLINSGMINSTHLFEKWQSRND